MRVSNSSAVLVQVKGPVGYRPFQRRPSSSTCPKAEVPFVERRLPVLALLGVEDRAIVREQVQRRRGRSDAPVVDWKPHPRLAHVPDAGERSCFDTACRSVVQVVGTVYFFMSLRLPPNRSSRIGLPRGPRPGNLARCHPPCWSTSSIATRSAMSSRPCTTPTATGRRIRRGGCR
jgi:hypothetical protein